MSLEPYEILPFRFERIKPKKVFLASEVGEFIFLSSDVFNKFVSYSLDTRSKEFLNLKSKHVATEREFEPIIDMLATKYRTKKRFLNDFTSLHMVVPTLRCNSRCGYCQASSKSVHNEEYDMNKDTAKKIVETIFMSPSRRIKIEFQGGEPLLNLGIVKFIIKYAEKLKVLYQKRVDFVVCSNLSLIDENTLRFFRRHNVVVSTSLDGPRELHNKNRPLRSTPDSYAVFMAKLGLAKNTLGMERISALMTATRDSLSEFPAIIDEYANNGFNSIFLRMINPYGLAREGNPNFQYSVEEFVEAYQKGLGHIIDLNLRGWFLVEEFACLLLRRIFAPFATGFVDLQSPAGVGIGGAIYNYDGDVYVSDEGRMLGEMGDKKFLMGNVHSDTYEELFNSEFLRGLISNSCLETLPDCHFCAYLPFCGADPVKNYVEQGDVIGDRTKSTTCRKSKLIVQYLFKLIEENNEDVIDVFWSWVTRRSLNEVRIR